MEGGDVEERTKVLCSERKKTGTAQAAAMRTAIAVLERQARGLCQKPPAGDQNSLGLSLCFGARVWGGSCRGGIGDKVIVVEDVRVVR